jgi:creatinine amidohydrolase/Fe(II)-dependent formamide hydrolase-like protein
MPHHTKALAALAAAFVLAALPVRADDDARSVGGGKCSDNAYNCVGAANPLSPARTLWLEHMTWMDVRDAIAHGKTTVIVPAGGLDPNGPWIALDKHDRIVATQCESIAQALGDALCAPVIPFVPEGGTGAKSEFADTPGALYISEPAYEALLADIATGLKHHGFRSIVMIGDHGGDVEGMQAVAARLDGAWHGSPAVVYIPEFYQSYDGAVELLYQKGLGKRGVVDGLHDDPTVTLMMMLSDPESVRWQERVKLGKASIDGVSIADRDKALAWGRELVDFRTRVTVEAIHKALAPRP